ncbi:triose-phosphate isomerase [Sodalis sp. CWE]|uniref:triose-phosphate isomerase n=1 Tax=Sodalis sp. CWE TaxID=2803816 RepID=UPI001C7D6CBC|nr:triose-phosphate isomerase [Sodalis sp. CWE]MBX4180687.1 triose-phosphate isomerase [Sodalis sp. CWE]
MRYPLVIGNWKLNGNKTTISELLTVIKAELNSFTVTCSVVIAPPMIYLDLVKRYLDKSLIMLGAQNVDIHISGPYTGEISSEMLKDIGTKYVIIGHSERRIYHKENDWLIAKKFSILKKIGLIPVLCIGENEMEKNAGKTEVVCAYQIDSILNHLDIKAFENIVIAYEPIWAIGTGKSATPSQAQKVHEFIRKHIAVHDAAIAKRVIIQYGGSVNTHNAAEFFSQPDIDGALVGQASLNAYTFSAIIKAASIIKQEKLDS